MIALFVCGSTSNAFGSQFTLTWTDNSSNEDGFKIERALANLVYTEVATVGPNVTTYVDATLLPSTLYSYRVRAYNSVGYSGYSNAASGTTPAAPANTAPTISNIADQTIVAGTNTGTLAFTVGDAETAATSLTVTRSSSNTTLVPTANAVLGGSGANRTITVSPAAGQTGTSTITVTVSDGSLSKNDTFLVTVSAPGPTISAQPQSATFLPGGSTTLSVSATGSGTITYQWYFNNVAISGATKSTYVISIAQRYDGGSYKVVVTAGSVSVTSKAVTLTAGTPPPSTSIFANLSGRALVQAGNNTLIPGFVIGGTQNKKVLLRAVGPTLGLAPFGLTGVLRNPQLTLKRLVGSVYQDFASNDDWGSNSNASTIASATASLGAFPLPTGSLDSALLVDLPPGQYSAIISDTSGNSGVSIVEIYDADSPGGGAPFSNLSNRGYLGTGSNVMVTGFVISGSDPKSVLIRTVGPTLGAAPFNVGGAVQDPVMEIHGTASDGSDLLILSNDDWSSFADAAYTAQITQQLGAFALPAGSRDSACVVTLPPGAYTVVSHGAGSSVGVALVEIYAAP